MNTMITPLLAAKGDYVSNKHSKVLRDKQGKKILIADIQAICKRHQLGKLNQLIGFTGGSTNTNLLIETSRSKYIVRFITYPPTIERLNYIEETLLFLQKSSLPVVGAIKNESDDYYSIVDNRMIQVYPYIEGLRYKDEPNQIKSSARMLSKLHSALVNHKHGPMPTDSIYPTKENLEKRVIRLFQNAKSLSSSSKSEIIKLYSLVMEQWGKAEYSNLPETIIHDDWHPWNLLYDKDGTVVGILDFECIRNGKRIYDIAYAIYQVYTHASEKNKIPYSKLLFNSYGELTPEEISIIRIIIAKVALMFIIKDPSQVEEHLKRNKPFIGYLLSTEGTQLLY